MTGLRKAIALVGWVGLATVGGALVVMLAESDLPRWSKIACTGLALVWWAHWATSELRRR